MIKRITIAAAGLALAVLSGCGVATAQDSTASEDAGYLTALDRGSVPHPDDAQAVQLGRSVCAQFDAGANLVTIGFTLMSTDLTPEQAGWAIGSAVAVFCPEHLEQVQGRG